MSYMILDIETSLTQSFKRKANPYDDRNYIVCWSALHEDKDLISSYYTWPDFIENLRYEIMHRCVDRIVCHNAKFDIAYLWKYDWFQQWLEAGGKIWCTMIAEYIITGQHHKYPSLNLCSAKYGGSQKIDVIKEQWDNGVDTKDIDADLLMEYNKEDVRNTEIVMKAQLEKLSWGDQLHLARRAMEDVLCTIEMEYNGMYIDKDIAEAQQKESTEIVHQYETRILDLVNDHIYKSDDWNPNSNDHISLWFFGGVLKTKQRQPKLDDEGKEQYYKSGLKKGELITTIQEVECRIVGLNLNPLAEWSSKKEGFYKTDEKVLELIAKGEGVAATLAVLLLQYRAENKVLGTYYKGLLDLRYEKGGCVHPDFQLVATHTGRMSCRNPNLQNQKRD
jgi:DNA polymerase-1